MTTMTTTDSVHNVSLSFCSLHSLNKTITSPNRLTKINSLLCKCNYSVLVSDGTFFPFSVLRRSMKLKTNRFVWIASSKIASFTKWSSARLADLQFAHSLRWSMRNFSLFSTRISLILINFRFWHALPISIGRFRLHPNHTSNDRDEKVKKRNFLWNTFASNSFSTQTKAIAILFQWTNKNKSENIFRKHFCYSVVLSPVPVAIAKHIQSDSDVAAIPTRFLFFYFLYFYSMQLGLG